MKFTGKEAILNKEKVEEKERIIDNKNLQKVKFNRGITLVALVITIIVLLILAGVTIGSISGDNGILNNASLAKVSTEFAGYKEEVELYKTNKLLEDYDFEADTLTAGKTTIEYEGKPEEETGNIKTIIQNLEDKYIDKFIIINGTLYLMATEGINDVEIKAAQNTGIEIMPYEISEEGELLSSNVNLALQGENGTLVIPDIVTSIGYGAFSGVEGLKKIVLPPSVTEIGGYAFSNNKELEEVEIQGNLTSIGEYAFDGATNLTKINLPDSISYIGMRAFRSTGISIIKIPKNLKIINYEAFGGMSNLSEVILQEGLNEISDMAFSYSQISTLKIPSTVAKISGGAFTGCNNLENFEIVNEENYSYESGILLEKKSNLIVFISPKKLSSITTFEIPEGITSFTTNISSYTNIKKLVMPSTLNSISVLNLPDSIEDIEVKEGNSEFIVDDENKILYDKENTLYVCYSKEKEINLPEGIITLGDRSFEFAVNAEIINLPDSLETIGDRVFQNCYKIKTIYIGQNVSIINPLFKMLNYNGTVVVDNDYYIVKDNILYKKDPNTGECTTLVKVLYEINGTMQISDEVKYIGDYAFYGQRKMTEIIIPEGVETIGRSFNYCSILKRVEISSTVKNIDSKCFLDATNNLEEIIIHNTEGSIQEAPWGAVKGMKVVQWVGK